VCLNLKSSMGFRSATSDDDGSRKVDEFLEGYIRTTADAACKKEIALSKITVWVNDEARWRQLSAKELAQLTQLNQGSICRAIATNLFKLDAKQYQSMKNSLDHTKNGLEGIYKKDNMYALILRLPVHLPDQRRRLAKLVSLPTLAVSSAGTLAYKVYNRIQPHEMAWRQSQNSYKFYSEHYWKDRGDGRFCQQYNEAYGKNWAGHPITKIQVAVKTIKLLSKYVKLFKDQELIWSAIDSWLIKLWPLVDREEKAGIMESDLIDVMNSYFNYIVEREDIGKGTRGEALSAYIQSLDAVRDFHYGHGGDKSKLDRNLQLLRAGWTRKKQSPSPK
jgi:hypothetical protein